MSRFRTLISPRGKSMGRLLGCSSVLCVLLMATNPAQGQTLSPWEMHLDGGEMALPAPLPSHGHPDGYVFAVIPDASDPGWMPAPDPETIGFSVPSAITGACLTAVDYTFFQAFLTVPVGTIVTEFSIAFSGMDDGSRVSIFNSTYPSGFVIPDSYVFLGGTGTTNLASSVVPGEVNRVVIEQMDDCCCGNNLMSAIVSLNGEPVMVPTLAEWGLIALAILLLSVGVFVIRRRTTAHPAS